MVPRLAGPANAATIAATVVAGAALMLMASACDAAEEQFWPEVDGFFQLDDRTRLFLMASATRAADADERGGSPRFPDGTLGAHVDISLLPIFRPELHDDNWERSRFLWMRIGYNYVGNYLADGSTYHEDRGILELNMREPLGGAFALTGRLKWDLRDVDGSYSNRYRGRLGLERELEAQGHTLVPYVQAEVSYDTRYDAWNKQRYETGIEIEMSKRWRVEPYFAHEDNSRGEPAHINALGLTLKYFH